MVCYMFLNTVYSLTVKNVPFPSQNPLPSQSSSQMMATTNNFSFLCPNKRPDNFPLTYVWTLCKVCSFHIAVKTPKLYCVDSTNNPQILSTINSTNNPQILSAINSTNNPQILTAIKVSRGSFTTPGSGSRLWHKYQWENDRDLPCYLRGSVHSFMRPSLTWWDWGERKLSLPFSQLSSELNHAPDTSTISGLTNVRSWFWFHC